MPDEPDLSTAWLTGAGPLPWSEVEGRFRDWDAVWQAADALRFGTVPTEVPWATHLWAWQGSTMARVRIDRERCFVTVLQFPDSTPDPENPGVGTGSVSPEVDTGGKTVRVEISEQVSVGSGDTGMILWSENDNRAAKLPDGIAQPSNWVQITTIGAAPVIFLARR